MRPAHASASESEPAAAVFAAYLEHLRLRGRGNTAYTQAARSFLRRWPHVQDWADIALHRQLAANSSTRPFVTFLMVTGRLQPGYDYLLARKLSSLWHELTISPLEPDLIRFICAARELGFTQRIASGIGSQVIARLLIQTNRGLDDITEHDLQDLTSACRRREQRTGQGWKHYRSTMHSARQILFHLGVLDSPAAPTTTRVSFEDRMADAPQLLQPSFVAYLRAKSATCTPKTVSSLATRLAHFGRFLSATDPALTSLADLDRRRHIEPFITSLTTAVNSVTGAQITVADRIRRVHAVGNFLAEIAEWGWDEAPRRRLVFRSDMPRPDRPLPRYLPVDSDRKLVAALAESSYRLAADALLLQRACGLRIGELLDLELDCVHEIPGQGSWLKIPLGKLDTERMVPIDDQVLTVIDRITATRSPGRPMRHPRTGAPADFLFTHHGKRLSQNAVRAELNRAATAAGLGHVTTHQLRHTYATALINAGVSLQALMALLGHVSTEMSLRYAHLFDSTVRTEYERALDLAKSQIGSVSSGRTALPLVDVTNGRDWKDAPAIKSRLAGGYCLRAPAQGSCPYANICEHCPSFHTDSTHLGVLAAQRVDAQALATDAQSRGWIDEAERHHALIARLDALITQANRA
jgi:integrase